MKFAIFGDIHANLEAFDAVMADAAAQGATHYVCIGDVVGYNANPAECVHRLQELGCPVVKGNHDEEASADTEIVGLNPLAQAALEWTRRALSEDDKAWLRALRMVRQVRDFTIVHSTLDTPTSWAYVMNKFDAMASFFSSIAQAGHNEALRLMAQTMTTVLRERMTHVIPAHPRTDVFPLRRKVVHCLRARDADGAVGALDELITTLRKSDGATAQA